MFTYKMLDGIYAIKKTHFLSNEMSTETIFSWNKYGKLYQALHTLTFNYELFLPNA